MSAEEIQIKLPVSSTAPELHVAEPRHRNQIIVSRPIFTEESLQDGYDENNSFTTFQKTRRSCGQALSKVTWRGIGLGLLKTFPIISWLKEYEWRKDIIGDTVSGLTTAVMRIPQGR